MKEMDKAALRWTKIGIILGALVPITITVIQLAKKPETKPLPASSPAQVTTAKPSQPEARENRKGKRERSTADDVSQRP
ncbi:MAG TPA: hypothetical protein VMX94_01995 [Armatimonadota bacterium]|nr:hypothetical protein [Armatimonadota bacterium]